MCDYAHEDPEAVRELIPWPRDKRPLSQIRGPLFGTYSGKAFAKKAELASSARRKRRFSIRRCEMFLRSMKQLGSEMS